MLSDGVETYAKMEQPALAMQKEKINSHLGRSKKSCQPAYALASSPCSLEFGLCQAHSCKVAWGNVHWDSPSSSQQSVVTWHIFILLWQNVSSLRKLREGLLENDLSKLSGSMLFIFIKKQLLGSH